MGSPGGLAMLASVPQEVRHTATAHTSFPQAKQVAAGSWLESEPPPPRPPIKTQRGIRLPAALAGFRHRILPCSAAGRHRQAA